MILQGKRTLDGDIRTLDSLLNSFTAYQNIKPLDVIFVTSSSRCRVPITGCIRPQLMGKGRFYPISPTLGKVEEQTSGLQGRKSAKDRFSKLAGKTGGGSFPGRSGIGKSIGEFGRVQLFAQ